MSKFRKTSKMKRREYFLFKLLMSNYMNILKAFCLIEYCTTSSYPNQNEYCLVQNQNIQYLNLTKRFFFEKFSCFVSDG